jgi:hypothetical protein
LRELDRKISDLVNVLPGPSARIAVAAFDKTRFDMALSRSEAFLMIAAPDRIEFRDPITLELKGTFRTGGLSGRLPCHIVWFAADPVNDAALAELKYSDFATQAGVEYTDVSEKRTFRGLEVEGNDQEIIRVDAASQHWQSLGLSQVARLHHPYDERGNPLGQKAEVQFGLLQQANTSREQVVEVAGDRSKMVLKKIPRPKSYIVPPYSEPSAQLLARDRQSTAQVFEIREWPPDMAEAGPPTVDLYAVLFTPDTQVIPLTGKSQYKEGSEPLAISGQTTSLGPPGVGRPCGFSW